MQQQIVSTRIHEPNKGSLRCFSLSKILVNKDVTILQFLDVKHLKTRQRSCCLPVTKDWPTIHWGKNAFTKLIIRVPLSLESCSTKRCKLLFSLQINFYENDAKKSLDGDDCQCASGSTKRS